MTIECSKCKERLPAYKYKLGVNIKQEGQELGQRWICEDCVELQGINHELTPNINYTWQFLRNNEKREVLGL